MKVENATVIPVLMYGQVSGMDPEEEAPIKAIDRAKENRRNEGQGMWS